MGAYNTLSDIEIACPNCGQPAIQYVQFKVGPCAAHRYHLGENIDWSLSGGVADAEAQTASRHEADVLVGACSACVMRYAWQYEEIRRYLQAHGRWGRLRPASAEAISHSEPNQQDGAVWIDGVYPAFHWMRDELHRLGSPLTHSLEAWDAVLVIKNNVLTEVIPPSGGWRLRPRRTTRELVDLCAVFQRTRDFYENPGWRNRIDQFYEQNVMQCREIESAPEYDSSFVDWLARTTRELISLPNPSVEGHRALAANLNALAVVGRKGPMSALKALAEEETANPLAATLLKILPEIAQARYASPQSARYVLQIEKETETPVSTDSIEVRYRIQASVRIVDDLEKLPTPPDDLQRTDPRNDEKPFMLPPEGA